LKKFLTKLSEVIFRMKHRILKNKERPQKIFVFWPLILESNFIPNSSWWDINHKKFYVEHAIGFKNIERQTDHQLLRKYDTTTTLRARIFVEFFQKSISMGFLNCWKRIWYQILKIQNGEYNVADTNTRTNIHFLDTVILWFFWLNDYEFSTTFWKVINDNFLVKNAFCWLLFHKRDKI